MRPNLNPMGRTGANLLFGRAIGAGLLGAAAAIWGTLYVAADWLMRFIPPFGLLELRFLIGGAVIVALAAYRGELGRPHGGALPYVILGLVGYLGSIGLQFVGTDLSGAVAGSLITAASPALIAVFAAWILQEPLSSRKAMGLLLGLLGIAAVVGWPGRGAHSLEGDLALCGAGVTWALYTVLARRQTRAVSTLHVTAWAGIFGALFTLPAALIEYAVHPWRLPQSIGMWSAIAYIAIVCTAGGFYLWNKGFEYLPAASGGMLLLVQPVVGGLLGALLLGEQLGWSFLVGAVLIALGVATAILPERQSAIAPSRQSTG